MDFRRQLALLPESLQSRPGTKKALATIAVLAALSGVQLYSGFVSKTLRSIRRRANCVGNNTQALFATERLSWTEIKSPSL